MDILLENLKKINARLALLGEDKDEIELWESIFQYLTDDKKKELITNLEGEIKMLEK